MSTNDSILVCTVGTRSITLTIIFTGIGVSKIREAIHHIDNL